MGKPGGDRATGEPDRDRVMAGKMSRIVSKGETKLVQSVLKSSHCVPFITVSA